MLIQFKAEGAPQAMSLIVVFIPDLVDNHRCIPDSTIARAHSVSLHGISLLFLPGFALDVLWYPFPHCNWIFTKLNRKSSVHDGRAVKDEGRTRALDLPRASGTPYAIPSGW